MADWNLINYIINQKRAGFKDEQITAYLQTRGYDQKTIQEAFFYANKPKQANTDAQAKPKKNPMAGILIIVFIFIVIGVVGFYLKDVFTGEGLQALGVESPFAAQTDETEQEIETQEAEFEALPEPRPGPAVEQEVSPEEPAETIAEETPVQEANETTEINQTTEEQTTEEPAETSAIPIESGSYTNEALQLSFNYPESWEIAEGTKTITFSLPVNNPNQIKNELKISRIKTSPSISTLSAFTDWLKLTFAMTGAATSTTIGGETANKMTDTVTSGSGETAITKKILMYAVIHGDYGYYFYYLAVDSDYAANSADVEALVNSVSFTY